MSYKTQEVVLKMGRVIKEHKTIFQGMVDDGVSLVPNFPTKYTVELDGVEQKLTAINQRFPENGPISIMTPEGGKSEILFDALDVSGAIPILDLAQHQVDGLRATRYIKKFKLFGGDKKIRKEMEAGRAGTRADGLILKREAGMTSQVMSKVTQHFNLLLLVRDGSEYFLTTAKHKVSYSMRNTMEFADKAVQTCVGQGIDVVYDPNNRSCAIIELKN
ncbi:MAG: hypothetical protein FWE31_05265 [Firmicutes bacterium]|nr:hypothetical protein [Bacillota bacterium]